MESLLDVCHGSHDIEVETVARSADHGQTIRFREMNDGVVVFLAGSKASGEFFDGEEVTIRGTGRIVEFFKKTFEFRLMTQGESDNKPQNLGRREAADRRGLSTKGDFARVARHERLCPGLTNETRDQHHREEGERK